MKRYLILILISFNFAVHAQNADEHSNLENILKQSMDVYQKPGDFELDIDYKIYSSKNREEASETYTGKLVKHDNEYLNTIDQTDFIYLKKGHLKINHQQKALMYTPAEEAEESASPIDLSAYIQSFDVKSSNENGSTLYFEMVPKAGVHGLGYSRVELYFAKGSYTVQKQIMHYAAPMEFKGKDGKVYQDFPVMEVAFSKYRPTTNIELNKFDMENYLIIAEQTVRLADGYKPYQLIDLSKH